MKVNLKAYRTNALIFIQTHQIIGITPQHCFKHQVTSLGKRIKLFQSSDHLITNNPYT